MDRVYLQACSLHYREVRDDGFSGIVFPAWKLDGLEFDHDQADLLILLPIGYPDVPPDMWYVFPWLNRAIGCESIPGTETGFPFQGRMWQRWSRHVPASSWRPGTHGLKDYLATIVREFAVASTTISTTITTDTRALHPDHTAITH